ncbi:AP endonuclease [Phlegmacium glaucopus]|nr:AP endonuclease [Phlegmacium glaucopus]
MQDIKSSKSPHTLTPQAEVSDATTSLKRVDSPWKVGAHVSAAGGVENTVTNAIAIGANAFALFLKAHRKWTSPSLTPQSILEFKKRMKQYGYANNMVLPHGNYLINLGNPDSDKREKSYECFLDDLKRCEELGLELYNFHPGSTVGATSTENSIAFIAECINRAHKATKTVKTVMENMAGAGNVIGSKFSDLAGIIAKVEDKTRIGVCIDTCHAFAAGYDIKTKEGWDATMIKFDEEIGLKYLCGMHLNDSKAACNSKKDRHQNIGLGLLGFSAFQYILQDPRTRNIPLILETPTFEQPNEIWSKEIGILQAFTNAPGAIKSEDLNSLVQKLKSVVGEAELKSGKRKKVVKSAKLAKRKAD